MASMVVVLVVDWWWWRSAMTGSYNAPLTFATAKAMMVTFSHR
jgi:hypothetical protein